MPIFGPLLDDFVQWMHVEQQYTLGSVSIYLNVVPKIVRWLRARETCFLAQLTLQQLRAAHDCFRSRHRTASAGTRLLEQFLRARGKVPEGDKPALSPVEMECERFAVYLRDTRGLAPKTIKNHRQRLQPFLRFIGLDRSPSAVRQLRLRRIESFLRQSARTNSRSSLQHVVATIRGFLRWRHGQGHLSRLLHQQIDTPRLYRGERWPRALAWDQVQALLGSIDQATACGQRDFALLYLAAAYGLRSCELVRLTLDDLDWPGRMLRILQTKTRQPLLLPLTDEAANVLIRYLRCARPASSHRQLFLRTIAPRGPLQPTAVRQVLALHLEQSGLNLPACGSHVLRHSFAMRLVQQGVPLKAIGDALGHRDIESTSVYIRLDVPALREVALPVPATVGGDPVALVSAKSLPRLRAARRLRHLPDRFQSRLAPALRRYVDLYQALGRRWKTEVAVLGHWDDFLRHEYPHARRVRAGMFTGWTRKLAHMTPTGSHAYQRIVRKFLLFHARDHTGIFVPDPLTFPKPAPVVVPRLVTETEMGRVLEAAQRLPTTLTNPLRAQTVQIGLILLFCCGLRSGELLRLRLGDLESEQTVLRIRMTKFHKSRWVPLSSSVTAELKEYLHTRRRKKLPMAPESLLMWSGHGASEGYVHTSLQLIWHQLCASTQVLKAHRHPPRLHDLRHSFAVNALHRWYAQGKDVQSKLPHLATYLGHVSAASTHYYLKLTPELRQAASQRFHQHFGCLFNTGGAA